MKKVSISDAKNGLSALIKEVGEGQAVYICDRGKPVAKLSPLSAGDETPEELVADLEKRGLAKRGSKSPPPTEFFDDAPEVPEGISASEYVTEERRSGR